MSDYRIVTFWNGERDIKQTPYPTREEAVAAAKAMQTRVVDDKAVIGANYGRDDDRPGWDVYPVQYLGKDGKPGKILTIQVMQESDILSPTTCLMGVAPEIRSHPYMGDEKFVNQFALPYGYQMQYPLGVHTLIVTCCHNYWAVHLRNHLELLKTSYDFVYAIGLWVTDYGLELEKLQLSTEHEILR